MNGGKVGERNEGWEEWIVGGMLNGEMNEEMDGWMGGGMTTPLPSSLQNRLSPSSPFVPQLFKRLTVPRSLWGRAQEGSVGVAKGREVREQQLLFSSLLSVGSYTGNMTPNQWPQIH